MKTTRTTKTSSFAGPQGIPWLTAEHQSSGELFRSAHRRMTTLTPVLLAAILYFPSSLVAQEPPPPPPAATPSAPQSTPGTGSSSSKTKNRAIPSFLIIGTVFNENALSFPGVQVRVRRSGEKKVIQQTYTNSRGEFAVRVPPGTSMKW